MAEFHFLRPWFLLGLIPLVFMISSLLYKRKNQNAWLKVCDPHLVQSLIKHVGQKFQRISVLFFMAFGLIMIVALSGPTWEKQQQASISQKKAAVIVLDMSKDMEAQDIKPTRLQRAKFKIQELLKSLSEGHVGLVVFTQEAFLVSPLTKDTQTLKSMLNELQTNIMPVDGTNIKAALAMSAKLITQAGYPSGNIILLTSSKATAEDIAKAKQLSKQNIHTSVMGIGTALGAPIFDKYGMKHIAHLDQESLEKLAIAGDGNYQPFSDTDKDVLGVVKYYKKDQSKKNKQKETLTVWKDQGRFLILLLLPLALWGFRRGFIESITA